MNIEQNPFMFLDNGMMNFNYFQNYMAEDFKNLFYMRILQDNIALREELNRRDFEGKSSSKQGTQPSHQQLPSITKIQPFSSKEQESDNESEVQSVQLKPIRFRRFRRNTKNETKNIPKNFGKAIISFVQHNKDFARRILSNFPSVPFSDFLNYIRSRKRKINSISDLRDLWNGINNPYSKPLRILSNCFLRRYSLEYIFNSRISNYAGHIKYRTRFLEALQNPVKFTNIKHY